MTNRARDRYDSLFKHYAEKHKIADWRLLKAQAIAESNLDPRAVSPVGAVGLTQFMPATWNEWWDNIYGVRGLPRGDRTNPEAAIELQAAYMRRLLRAFKTEERALAAYNWGWGRVRKHLRRHNGTLVKGLLPHETRTYIARIERVRATL